MLLIVVLLLGVFILSRTESRGTAASSSQVRSTTGRTTTTRSSRTTVASAATTTRPARPPADVKVLPANGSGVSGLGQRVGDRLKAKGYNALAPANATKDISASQVEYAADFEQEARVLATNLGLAATAVKALEPSPPVADTKGADIVVFIGPDLSASGATSTTK
ncbi:MAG: LytR C-terminal domain-containing protein [Acidimicrobiales bacterium]